MQAGSSVVGPTCRLAGCCTQMSSSGRTGPTGTRLRLLDTATGSGSLEGLTILGSGTGASCGRRLLDIAFEDAVLVNLAILGLGCGGRLGCGFLSEEPFVTVVWSLQKLPGAVCEEINSNGAF